MIVAVVMMKILVVVVVVVNGVELVEVVSMMKGPDGVVRDRSSPTGCVN